MYTLQLNILKRTPTVKKRSKSKSIKNCYMSLVFMYSTIYKISDKRPVGALLIQIFKTDLVKKTVEIPKLPMLLFIFQIRI